MEKNTSSKPPSTGIVVCLRGHTVEVRFIGGLPSILTLRRAGNTGYIVIDVLAQRDARQVRGIGVTSTHGLVRAAELTAGPGDRSDASDKLGDEDRETIIEQARAAPASFPPKPATTVKSESR